MSTFPAPGTYTSGMDTDGISRVGSCTFENMTIPASAKTIRMKAMAPHPSATTLLLDINVRVEDEPTGPTTTTEDPPVHTSVDTTDPVSANRVVSTSEGGCSMNSVANTGNSTLFVLALLANAILFGIRNRKK